MSHNTHEQSERLVVQAVEAQQAGDPTKALIFFNQAAAFDHWEAHHALSLAYRQGVRSEIGQSLDADPEV